MYGKMFSFQPEALVASCLDISRKEEKDKKLSDLSIFKNTTPPPGLVSAQRMITLQSAKSCKKTILLVPVW